LISRALDSNNDLIVHNGQFVIVKNGAEIVQHVRTRLLFYANEWFLDLSSGIPYFEQIFVRPVNLGNVESIFKTAILQTPGVDSLINFSMVYEGGSVRKLSVDFEAKTVHDEIITSEVTVNV